MAREGLLVQVRACAALGTTLVAFHCVASLPADPGNERERSVATILAVQTAMHQGREHLLRNNPSAAVKVLEAQLAHIDGKQSYLALLRDAYRAHIRELRLSNQEAQVQDYLQRLRILDPSAAVEAKSQSNPAASSQPTSGAVTRPVPVSSAAPDERTKTAEATPPSSLAIPKQPEGSKPGEAGQVATAPPNQGPTFRGARGEDDNPFDQLLTERRKKARQLLEMAEQELTRRKYREAHALYEQAHKGDEHVTELCRERWAYCKLYQVVEQLKDPQGKPPAYPQIETEIKRAIELAPRMDYARHLLGEVEKRKNDTPIAPDKNAVPEPEVNVRHAETAPDGWEVAETTNFRIFHNQSRAKAEQVARTAERTRADMHRKWFTTPCENWNPRCDIYVHATGDDYSRATSAPAATPGHSTFKFEASRVFRRIDVHFDDPNMTVAVLPHETTHAVLAGNFGSKALPRWADEGMAILSEPRHMVERHFLNLPRHRHDRELFSIRQIIEMDDYPHPRYLGPFYAQSVSLVDFLVKEKGPQVFAKFIKTGLRVGWPEALRQSYGYATSEELERRWYGHALDEGRLRGVVQRP